jgi:hypothetical protein
MFFLVVDVTIHGSEGIEMSQTFTRQSMEVAASNTLRIDG